jgi:hypothetical protein
MASSIDRDILFQTLRGYAEVNAITEAERRERLARISSAENWEIFDALYETWEITGKRAGGNWKAIARQRLADAIALRRAFEVVARRKGLI